MPSFRVTTAAHSYEAVIERGAIVRAASLIPAGAGKIFVVTTPDVWKLHGERLKAALPHTEVLFFPGGEDRKRLSEVERLAEQMVERGADRTSIVVAFGGGIVTDLGGFLASIFMRGIPVIQIPTTLLAQVDAAVGGKTGANLVSGKNLIGAFRQPMAVLIDPEVIATLPEREYRAGLYEIIKAGVIRDPLLFEIFEQRREEVLDRSHAVIEEIVAISVRIKAEVVSEDERETDLRRILNFGHTIGHALEAETGYQRLLHGEAVAFGMLAAGRLAELATGFTENARLAKVIHAYGPIPSLAGIAAEALVGRLVHDKKTLKGKVHFVLPVEIGEVKVMTGVDPVLVLSATQWALGQCSAA